jgi:hypothetical protein
MTTGTEALVRRAYHLSLRISTWVNRTLQRSG